MWFAVNSTFHLSVLLSRRYVGQANYTHEARDVEQIPLFCADDEFIGRYENIALFASLAKQPANERGFVEVESRSNR